MNGHKSWSKKKKIVVKFRVTEIIVTEYHGIGVVQIPKLKIRFSENYKFKEAVLLAPIGDVKN